MKNLFASSTVDLPTSAEGPSFHHRRAFGLTRFFTALALLGGFISLASQTPGATVSQDPWKINGGKADFGTGSHHFGSPDNNGVITWDLSVINGLLIAKATVSGRLYYDSLSGAGTARLIIQFKKVTSNNTLQTVATRVINVSGPGGDANLASNQIAVNENFSDRDLFTVVMSTAEVDSNGNSINLNTIVDPTDSNWSFSPTINNGSSDFGTGTHSFGSPSHPGFVAFFRSLPNASLTPTTPLGSMLGVVSGTLYWDAAFSSGTARMIIDFQDASGNTLSSRTRDVSGPGGDANNSSNQRSIDENFVSPSVFQVRLRVGQVSNGSFVNIVSNTYKISSASTGTFLLQPSTAEVDVHDRVDYAFTWTVPAPMNWHDLDTLRLRIRDLEGVILSLVFDEATQTFALVNERNDNVGPAFPGGSNARLQTSQATLYLADSSVVGSGPTGPSVTLHLSLGFKPQAAGRTFLVEVGASNDAGEEDTFTPAGSLTVSP